MSRLPKFLLVSTLLLFMLACGLISGPVSDIKNAASTAESVASALPINTIEALAILKSKFKLGIICLKFFQHSLVFVTK